MFNLHTYIIGFSSNKPTHYLLDHGKMFNLLLIKNTTKFIYLFINYNTTTNYIIIIYELSNFDHLLGVVSQIRVSGGNRTHDPHTNSLAHYPLD